MNRKGFTFIEVLIAVALAALAATLLYQTFFQGMRCARKVQAGFEDRRLGERVSRRFEKDLKNTVYFSPVPFTGQNHRVLFASLDVEVRKISYELREKEIIRREEPVRESEKDSAVEISLADHVERFDLEYAYRGTGDNILFFPYWMAARLEIPRAVKMTIVFESRPEQPKSLFLFLPQGRLGEMNV